jgi:hypothetical protein
VMRAPILKSGTLRNRYCYEPWVPELTGSADIKLNERVLLRR